MVALLAGGFFIFPLTQLTLRLMGGRASLSAENWLNKLAMQVAFTLPPTCRWWLRRRYTVKIDFIPHF